MIKRLNRLHGSIPEWAWLILLAVGLRIVTLGSESYWYDEAYTVQVVQKSWPQVIALISNDVHPFLWYAIEWINVRLFGTSEFMFRLPDLILSVIAVLLVWQIARNLFMDKTPFLAGVLAAIIPASIYYGQDARMYPLLACCVLGAVLAAKRDNYLLYFLCGLGAILSQNLGLFYIAVLSALWILFPYLSFYIVLHPSQWIKRDTRLKVLTCLAILMTWGIVWAPVFIHQASAVQSGFWLPTLSLSDGLTPDITMTLGQRFPSNLIVFGGLIAFGLTMLGIASTFRLFPHNLRARGFYVRASYPIGIALGVPLAMALISVIWHRSIYLPRAMFPAALLLMIVWADGLMSLSRRDRRAVLLAAAPVLAVALIAFYFPGDKGRFPYRDWAAQIRQNWQQGDVIYSINEATAIPDGYYLNDLPAYLLPTGDHLYEGGLTSQAKVLFGFHQATFEHVAGTGLYHRAWIIIPTSPLLEAEQNLAAAHILNNYACTVQRSTVSELETVTLYLCDFSVDL